MPRLLALALAALWTLPASLADMEGDPEAVALRQALDAMRADGVYLDDSFDGEAKGRLTGPVTFAPGRQAEANATDRAALFPDERVAELFVYYGAHLPERGELSVDFRIDALPGEHNFMTLCSMGTAGNTCLTVRAYLDRTIRATLWTRRENITLVSGPFSLGDWHHLSLRYGPEGSLLALNGTIHDFSLDYSAPYAHGHSTAFYLGDQPWWDPANRTGVFYPLDSFAGRIDNLKLCRLAPTGGNP